MSKTLRKCHKYKIQRQMIQTRLYLDVRRPDRQGLYTLYLVLAKNGTTAMTSLGIKLLTDQWSNGEVVNHPQKKTMNAFISAKKSDFDRAILELNYNGAFVNKTAKESLTILKEYIDPELAAKHLEEKRKNKEERSCFSKFFLSYIDRIETDGTRGLYLYTYHKIEDYCSSVGINFYGLSFEDISRSWLESFERFCLTTQKQNSASRHLRDIRAVFNAAIDDGRTNNYPFRKYKIIVAESRDKSFTASQLRRLFNYECYEGGEQEAVDVFKLMFCLIGINPVDLVSLEETRNGRVEYVRMKTHKLYSVKLEPEAIAIIERYKGEKHLLNLTERFPNYKTYFNRVGKTLRKVGKVRISGKKSTGKAILPDVCLGSARTSWATIAQEELDIPREVIAAALGHSTVDVTTTYLRTRWRKKVDDANRRVLDRVFYQKKKK